MIEHAYNPSPWDVSSRTACSMCSKCQVWQRYLKTLPKKNFKRKGKGKAIVSDLLWHFMSLPLEQSFSTFLML